MQVELGDGLNMRRCLVPSFIGKIERGLDAAWTFDTIVDVNTIVDPSDPCSAVSAIALRAYDWVDATLAASQFPVVVSGDCMNTIGCVAAANEHYADLVVVWIDAHADFHTSDTTISGHLGGMPLAMLSGRGDQFLLKALDAAPVPDNRIILVGARDVEVGESGALDESAVEVYSSISEAWSRIREVDRIWVHFDADYLSPMDAPAMRYCAVGGPRLSEALEEMTQLASHGGVIGLSVSAWAPHLDDSVHTTARACWSVLTPFDNSTLPEPVVMA